MPPHYLGSQVAADSRADPREELIPKVWDGVQEPSLSNPAGGSETEDVQPYTQEAPPSAVLVLPAGPPTAKPRPHLGAWCPLRPLGWAEWDRVLGASCSPSKAEVPFPRDERGLSLTAPSPGPAGQPPPLLTPLSLFLLSSGCFRFHFCNREGFTVNTMGGWSVWFRQLSSRWGE